MEEKYKALLEQVMPIAKSSVNQIEKEPDMILIFC